MPGWFYLLLLWVSQISSKVILLSGATGVLGRSLSHAFLQTPLIAGVYAGYRDVTKLELLPKNALLNPFALDLKDVTVGLETIGKIISKQVSNEIILINNAAICPVGMDRNTLRHTLQINTLCPIIISKSVAKYVEKYNQINKEKVKLSIINISSGDGELVYLQTAFKDELLKIKSLVELEDFILTLHNRNCNDIVYSNGETPCYSLSKALLNRFTVLFSNEIDQTNTRVVSVCPGNFMSSMTASEELTDLHDLNTVTAGILSVALDWKHNTGLFYRFGEIIPY